MHGQLGRGSYACASALTQADRQTHTHTHEGDAATHSVNFVSGSEKFVAYFPAAARAFQ